MEFPLFGFFRGLQSLYDDLVFHADFVRAPKPQASMLENGSGVEEGPHGGDQGQLLGQVVAGAFAPHPALDSLR